MPARTHLVVIYSGFFAVVVLGLILARTLRPEATPVYELSNSVVLSGDGIATNANLTGQYLAEVELIAISGEVISTKTFRGTPMIINIWYSTCEPCRREMPILAASAKKYSNQVRFIGINIKDTAKVATEFAQKYGVKFELLLDANGRFITATKISTAPVTLAVNAEGTITNQVAGEISADKLEEIVKELLK